MWSRWFQRSARVNTQDEVIECPCYRVCAGLGLEVKRWCRYRKSDEPNPGMHRFDPKDEWCPTGVQATVLLLGHMLANGAEESALAEKLGEVRTWVQSLRRGQPSSEELDDTSTTRRRK